MGPLFVLIIWAVVAGVLSVIGGSLLAGFVGVLTRGVTAGRKRALLIAGFLPASGFVYLFACILVFSIWSSYRDRDMGWGDSWDTPILGKYHLNMIDVTDQATIYDRSDPKVYKTGSISGSPGQRNVIFGVRRLEVRPPFLLGTAAPEKFQEYPAKSPETLFFILDTRTNMRTDEPSLVALQNAAQQLGAPLHLEAVDVIYNRYRYDKRDLIVAVALAIPPLLAFIFLTRALLRLRATRTSPAALDPT